jgi:hypothetical protein
LAAALARGELLLLLNNDVLVGDHALDRIAGTFADHPGAGVVGAAMWSLEQLQQQWQFTLDTEQPQAGHPWLLAADRGLLGRPLGWRDLELWLLEQLPALPDWDRQELRILASSSGLHGDGWLETPSRLVIQLLGQGVLAGGLRLGLYLPEQGLQAGGPRC